MTESEPRGQVGIGTLIVFIAMVLVAAIAGAVLIDTAGYLQGKSENTGEQTSKQVTNRLHLVSVRGTDVDGAAGTVGNVTMVVTVGPGSDPINLQNVTMQWVGPDSVERLTAVRDPRFGYSPIKDSDGSFPVMSNADDRVEIELDLDGDKANTGSVSALKEGEDAKIRLTMKSGGTLLIKLSVPEEIRRDDTSVRL